LLLLLLLFFLLFNMMIETRLWNMKKSNHQVDEKRFLLVCMYVCIIKLIVEQLADGQSIDRQRI